MEIKNLNRLIKKLQKINSNTKKYILNEYNYIAQLMRNEAIAKVSQAGTGKIYKKKNKTHQASRPGQAPATDTGILKANIFADLAQNQLAARFGVKAGVKYARMLEYGTSKMKPRPFIRPAFKKFKDRINPAVIKAIRKAIQEVLI
jgi:HK97 gp10 family phage protein